MKILMTFFFLLITHDMYASCGGGSVGNGSDDTDLLINKVAWFTMNNSGEEPMIEYCLERAPDFPQTDAELEKMIQTAYTQWADYMFTPPGSSTHDYGENIKAQRIVMKVKRVACSGEESLKFYFGSENEVIRERKKSYVDPIAFAHRLEMEVLPTGQKKLWSTGYIWLTSSGSTRPEKSYPNWKNSDHLYSILLHEIGHTLGNPHVPGTIMSEKFSDLMWKPEFNNFDPKRYMRKIDITREMYNHYERAETHHGELFPKSYNQSAERTASLYTALTGGVATPELKAVLTFEPYVRWTGPGEMEILQKGSLILRNGSENKVFNFDMNSATESDWLEAAEVFVKWNGEKITHGLCIDQVRYGEITLSSGEKKTVVMEKGMRKQVRNSHEFYNSNVTLFVLGLGSEFPMKQEIFSVSPTLLK